MWREFRADCAKTGNLPIIVGENFRTKWEYELDPNAVIDEPVIGLNGEVIFSAVDGTVTALDEAGAPLWGVKSLQDPSGPAVMSDGVVIVPQLGRINAISSKGKVLWDQKIDGKPTPASLLPHSEAIAVNSYSTDWMGTYLLNNDGSRIFNTSIKSPFKIDAEGKGVIITPPAVGLGSQNIYSATRTFGTYASKEEECPEPEHHYNGISLTNEGKILWQETSSTLSLWGECRVSLSPFPRDASLETALFLLDHAIYLYHHQTNVLTPILNTFDFFTEDVPESIALAEMVPFQSDLCIIDNPAFDPKTSTFIYRMAKKVESSPTGEPLIPPPDIQDLPCFCSVNWVNAIQAKKPFSANLWYHPFTSAPAIDKAGTIFMGIPGGIGVITSDGEKNDIALVRGRDPVRKIIIRSEDTLICVMQSGKIICAEKI